MRLFSGNASKLAVVATLMAVSPSLRAADRCDIDVSKQPSVCGGDLNDAFAEVNPMSSELQPCIDGIRNCVTSFMKKSQIDGLAQVFVVPKGKKLAGADLLSPKNRDLAMGVAALGVGAGVKSIEPVTDPRQLEYMTQEEFDQFWPLLLELEASCHRNQVWRNPSEAIACSVRFNKDLWRYKLLASWPGCNCGWRGKLGKLIGGVCMTDITASAPIDERVPKALETFARKYSSWAGLQGYKVRAMDFMGCTTSRLVKSGAQKSCNCQRNVTLQDVSAHGEARACDLEAITLEDSATGKTRRVSVGDGAFGAGFSGSLRKYLEGMTSAERASLYIARAQSKTHEIPRGVPDHERLWAAVEARGSSAPKGMSSAEWFQLRSGLAAQRLLIESGFFVMDAFTDQAHESHFHITVSSKRSDWQVMSASEPRLDEKVPVTQRALCTVFAKDPLAAEGCAFQ